jgi:hypothetical protein
VWMGAFALSDHHSDFFDEKLDEAVDDYVVVNDDWQDLLASVVDWRAYALR